MHCTYRVFKPGKSLQASIFCEYPDPPGAGHPLPRNHLHLVGVDLVLAARLAALEDEFRVSHLELSGHHSAADLGRDVGVLEEVHGGVQLLSLAVLDDGVTERPTLRERDQPECRTLFLAVARVLHRATSFLRIK